MGELFEASAAFVADTPGFASLDTGRACYIPKTCSMRSEFGPYLGKCQFTGCAHRSEKGCAVLAALKAGELSPSRYASYAAMYDEVKDIRTGKYAEHTAGGGFAPPACVPER